MADLGGRCLIAPGFGEIFEANCLNNGLLPLRLAGAEHARVLAAAQASAAITVSLPDCTLAWPGNTPIRFMIDARVRHGMLAGQDEIAGILLEEGGRIRTLEQRQRTTQPWLYPADAAPCT